MAQPAPTLAKSTKKNGRPLSVYAGLATDGTGVALCFRTRDAILREEHLPHLSLFQPREIAAYLARYQRQERTKIIGIGLVGADERQVMALGSELWIKQDIVPFYFVSAQGKLDLRARSAAQDVLGKFQSEHIVTVELDRKRMVHTSRLTTLSEYARTTKKETFQTLLDLADKVRDKRLRVVFFSSTPAGGGVALMRHALIRLGRLLDLDLSWHVLSADSSAFRVTKRKFHNILQGIAAPTLRLSPEDKRIYNQWIAVNADFFRGVYEHADVVVIDDPQPSGLIPAIRKANPAVKIIYRSHIQLRADLMAQAGTPQAATWDFLKPRIYQADLFVSHPVKAFVPEDLPLEKVVFMPATTDPLDGLNKPLSEKLCRYYLDIFNDILLQSGQKPLNPKRPYLIQIARFDPSKGIPDVIEAYRRLRKKLGDLDLKKTEIPQLVIVGNGAIDDPEGGAILEETLFSLSLDRYQDLADDIKVARLPHIDQLLNALLRSARVALQLSHREGFEIKATEALHKGVPVIVYRSGGLPLQVKDQVTGYVVKTGNSKKVTEHLYHLLTHKRLHAIMSKQASETGHGAFFTVPNLCRWLALFLALTDKKPFTGNGEAVDAIIKKRYGRKKKTIR